MRLYGVGWQTHKLNVYHCSISLKDVYTLTEHVWGRTAETTNLHCRSTTLQYWDKSDPSETIC